MECRLDPDAGTAQVVWEYTEPGWLEPIVGDADRLDNGKVLITLGHCACCWWALSPDHWSALVAVVPETNTVAWRLDWPDDTHGGYRAERYDGCGLFGHAAYCPAVQERVEALP